MRDDKCKISKKFLHVSNENLVILIQNKMLGNLSWDERIDMELKHKWTCYVCSYPLLSQKLSWKSIRLSLMLVLK